MVYDSKNITVAAGARVRTSAEGVQLPPKLGSAATWDSGWNETGWVSPDGAKFSSAKSYKDVEVLQSLYPVLKIAEKIEAAVSTELVELTRDNFALAFGGGSWSVTDGIAKYTPPPPEFIDVRQVSLDWNFQGFNHRLVLWRAMQTGEVEVALAREEMKLPLELSLLGVDGTDPWNYFTDNPAMLGADGATVTAPGLTSLSPTSGAVGDTVTLTGTGFVAGMTVKFGTYTSQTVNVASPTSATATVPTGTTGTVDVTVTNAAGTSTAQQFTVA